MPTDTLGDELNGQSRTFGAVIADMDGVITDTAVLHERAWKQLFDEFFATLKQKTGNNYAAFTSADYRAHVDGKPRYDGVADFLQSRGIRLPWGDPTDSPADETVCGLGNRKDRYFLERLEREGVAVFDDARSALAQWRSSGLSVAIISASRHCRQVLDTGRVLNSVDLVVDGQTALERSLNGKSSILEEASRELGVAPERTVVFEDAIAGVRAASDAGFGLVIGVSRNDNEKDLRAAGAITIVHQLDHASFPGLLPPE